MAYKFKLDEPLDKGLRRIADTQLGRTCEAFDSLEAKVWVHEARKSLKRVRALLRLLRDALRKSQWRRLNTELRDIGRLLSGHRDRDVRRETLAVLARDAGKGLAAAVERVTGLEADGRPDTPIVPLVPQCPTGPALGQAVDRMRLMRQELAEFDSTIDAAHVEIGLERTHRAGHRLLEAIHANATDEQFHELRKVVQLHWRQMQLLGAAWPDLFKARIAGARALAQVLGREHDFAALAQWLAQPESGRVPRQDVRLIVAACRQAQAALRTSALRDAEILFAGGPRVFASEAIAYWSAAVAARAAKGTKRAAPRRNRATRGSARRAKAAATEGTKPSHGEGGGGEALVRSKTSRKARTVQAGRARSNSVE